MFGMEIETRIPVTFKDGESIEEYPHIAEHKEEKYHIDVDFSEKISILEFVMHAFDEHKTTLEEAYKELDARLELIERFITTASQAKSGTPLADVCKSFGVTISEAYDETVLNAVNNPGNNPLNGPIHFTVGFAPEVIPRLILDKLRDETFVNDDGKTILRATQAALLPIDRFIDVLSFPRGANRRMGYLALLYMQIAAAMDGAKDTQSRLKKNRTQALCRVPFSVIYKNLPAEDKLWLQKNQDALLGCMQRQYSGQDQYSDEDGKWGEKPDDKNLVPRPAKSIIKAAFGESASDSPEDIFGKMTVIGQGEPVGATGLKQVGYALELRRLRVTSGNPDSRRAVAHALLAYSRLIHGTDK
ncbi:MAG TPA: hypothetical protein VFN35_08130 [Ktedonobacteraceae bacterium]|nr:hypothetical protein [Ktedonobacteraceae bacterium]